MIKPGKGLVLESAAIRAATAHDTDHLEVRRTTLVFHSN
jgi:hypothetical protein